MDRDRVQCGSLLNKAYEMQCLREREINIIDMLQRMDMDQEEPMSNEERLFSAPIASRPNCHAPPPAHLPPTPPTAGSSPPQQQTQVFNVVGGRFVAMPMNGNGGANFPLNGQQLQMQLDQLTSAMTDMIMMDESMEVPANPAYNQYMQERTGVENPHSQEEKRRDPVYLSSMATHTIIPSPPPSPPQLTQEQADQMEQQWREQQWREKQMYEQLQRQEELQRQQAFLAQHVQASDDGMPEREMSLTAFPGATTCNILPPHQEVMGSTSRIMKRPDLVPIQKCIHWS